MLAHLLSCMSHVFGPGSVRTEPDGHGRGYKRRNPKSEQNTEYDWVASNPIPITTGPTTPPSVKLINP